MKQTHQLDKDSDLWKSLDSPFGLQTEKDDRGGYIRLPLGSNVTRAAWRIMLEIGGPSRGVLPLEIADDVVVGRGAEGDDAPTLDLTALDAFEQGVSRRHAMFRPTPNALYILDLGSSNGTFINGGLVGRGMAHALNQGDLITFGSMNMTIVYIKRSATAELKPQAGVKPPDAPKPEAKDKPVK